ncbi:hypothetical protein F4777DRAFT_576679 [Nemania sp. FL0916]|nr:hypothetical protein F4777DRAFT_576679 [Nemania sp. FL0916]
MAPRGRPAKESRAAKEAPEKKPRKNRGLPKPNQPVAAGRLIASPYVKYGWHKPLTAEAKAAASRVSSIADSFYMCQLERSRPIEAGSLRNALFYERRQLTNPNFVSTPAIDHLDLFGTDEADFEKTLADISKIGNPREVAYLHDIFRGIRDRQFLILPVEMDGNKWVTIIAEKRGYVNQKVTHLAIVDPFPQGRAARRSLIISRLERIFAEGCIELTNDVDIHDLAVKDVEESWQTGLVAYAISREFLRRLEKFTWRVRQALPCSQPLLVWGAFDEMYNFDSYRQSLTAAIAFQAIEMSGFRIRMALEVPSEDSGYDRSRLSHVKEEDFEAFFHGDEKFDPFEANNHNVIVGTPPTSESESLSSSNDNDEDMGMDTDDDVAEVESPAPPPGISVINFSDFKPLEEVCQYGRVSVIEPQPKTKTPPGPHAIEWSHFRSTDDPCTPVPPESETQPKEKTQPGISVIEFSDFRPLDEVCQYGRVSVIEPQPKMETQPCSENRTDSDYVDDGSEDDGGEPSSKKVRFSDDDI